MRRVVKLLILVASIFFGFSYFAFADINPKAFIKDGNVYYQATEGETIQLTSGGKDSEPVLSPTGDQIIFIRQIHELKDNPFNESGEDAALMYMAWSPNEIWTVNLKDKKPKVLVKARYLKDGKKTVGWFYDLNFSPDGKKIYYAGNPCCPTTNVIRVVNNDGRNDRWIRWGQSVDVIGGDKNDKYYGYLVLRRKATDGAYDVHVLTNSNGKEIEIISDIEVFWKKHKKNE